MTLTLFAASFVGMVALFGLGLRTAETQEQQATTATQTTYEVQDLGTLPGGSSSDALDINDSGQVVGRADTSDGASHAFLYDKAASPQMQDLGTLGGSRSTGYSINNSGQVVGSSYSSNENGDTHAFLYDKAASPQMQDLGTLGGTYSSGYGINNSGKVVGDSYTSDENDRAFLYDKAASPQMQDLGTLGGPYSSGSGINDSGKVVGGAYTSDAATPGNSDIHAFLYDKDASPQMQDLGTLGGTFSYSYAVGINDSGQVVGHSYSSAGDNHAFLYDKAASPQMQDLGTLGGTSSLGYGINDSGKVVGYSRTSDGASHAFLYDKAASQQMQDLNTLIPQDSGWTLESASAINKDGQIAATGSKDGHHSAVLLTPKPPEVPPDTTKPTITLKVPADNATYKLNAVVKANYSCADEAGGSGLASCVGTVPNGTAINTRSVGPKTFTVEAADKADNKSTLTNHYTVVSSAPTPPVVKPRPRGGILLGESIVFSASTVTPDNPEGDTEIFTMDSNGANVKQLTKNTGQDRNPVWSPDGTRIAFEGVPSGLSFEEIYVMNADGTGLTRLTNNPNGSDKEPTWSPNGSQIAFSHALSNDTDHMIYKMQANGTNQVKLTTPEVSDSQPSWSPDGSRIAFVRAKRDTVNFVVATMKPDGSDIRELTANPTLPIGQIYLSVSPDWSPNGTQIVFSSNRDNTGTLRNEIYTMRADGSRQVRRTYNSERDFFPAWSPGGTRIAFTRFKDPVGPYEIYTMKADGSNQVRLRTGSEPDWTFK